ncbi:MAG: hypothetical protein J7480_09070 [Microbacteriaceae bacterium]|nr:hypothetical protein [Microbacteriaceae bacterium]
MVNPALLEQVKQLALEDKAQLRSVLDADLVDVSPDFAGLLDARWAEIEANRDDYVSIDEDERELRARRPTV